MKKGLRFLVLTDHRVHHPRNPIYSLLPELLAKPQTLGIDIASRGNPANDSFFYQQENIPLEVLEVSSTFAFEDGGKAFLLGQKKVSIQAYDAVLMRLPRPVESEFMEFLAQWDRELVFINHPMGIEKTSNKAYLLNFPHLCPPMKLCHRLEDIRTFAQKFPIVLKPLKEYGGKGILKIDGEFLQEGEHHHPTWQFLEKQRSYIQQHGYLAMKFMEQVTQGDKRIILAGKDILGTSLRIPAEGSWLCNVAQGGTSFSSQLDPSERHIIEQLLPDLSKEGILIAGIDTLMGDDGERILSEINSLSVGGFLNLQEQSGKPILAQLSQIIIDYVYHQIRK